MRSIRDGAVVYSTVLPSTVNITRQETSEPVEEIIELQSKTLENTKIVSECESGAERGPPAWLSLVQNTGSLTRPSSRGSL